MIGDPKKPWSPLKHAVVVISILFHRKRIIVVRRMIALSVGKVSDYT